MSGGVIRVTAPWTFERMLEKSPWSLRPPCGNHLHGAGEETVKPGSNAKERCGGRGTGGCLQRRRRDRVWHAPPVEVPPPAAEATAKSSILFNKY
jgi:hypothetical protein